jgi:cytochrome c-type biogenesis protein CcmE
MDLAQDRALEQTRRRNPAGRAKFFIGGLLIIGAVVLLVVSSLQTTQQYFLTVQELQDKGAAVAGREIRISGAVIGDSIQYDPDTLTLRFTIAHTPGDQKEVDAAGGLAEVLHQAVLNTSAPRLQVEYKGVMPDLLRNEAQAIMTGKMGSDGVFRANELLLKCPTKYEDAVPEQAASK